MFVSEMISLVSFAVVDTAEVSSNRNSSSRFISSPPRRLSEHFATLMSGSSGDAPRPYALWPRLAPYLAGESLEGTDAARSGLATQFDVASSSQTNLAFNKLNPVKW